MTRKRDRLGRPLPEGDRLGPAQDARPTILVSGHDALLSACTFLEEGRPFEAHEVLEDRWRCCPAEERDLWRALARLAAAVTHAGRGNATGAYSVGRTSLSELLVFLDRRPSESDNGPSGS